MGNGVRGPVLRRPWMFVIVRHVASALVLTALFGASAGTTSGLVTGAVPWDAAAGPDLVDADEDGIRDDWERAHAPVPWFGFAPRPNRPDLLVEFVRLDWADRTPDVVDFAPAYRLVAEFFRTEGGIELSWIETRLEAPAGDAPGFLEP